MSKKHFQALAEALKSARALGNPLTDVQWMCDVKGVANVCARFNPLFDRAKFLKACGVGE